MLQRTYEGALSPDCIQGVPTESTIPGSSEVIIYGIVADTVNQLHGVQDTYVLELVNDILCIAVTMGSPLPRPLWANNLQELEQIIHRFNGCDVLTLALALARLCC